ncbi:MAG: hypothetical protein QM751_11040 [Paludibacteraceae bacterium]
MRPFTLMSVKKQTDVILCETIRFSGTGRSAINIEHISHLTPYKGFDSELVFIKIPTNRMKGKLMLLLILIFAKVRIYFRMRITNILYIINYSTFASS